MQWDDNFRSAWQEVKARVNDVFTQHLVSKAVRRSGVIANLALLKYNETGSWVEQNKFNVVNNFILPKTDVIDAKSYLEAEEVKPNTQISERHASNNVSDVKAKHEI